MTDPTLSLRRRQLLAGGAGALAGTGLIGLAGEAAAQAAAPAASAAATGARPLPAYVAWKDPTAVIVHSATTIETKRSAFGTSGITPAENLYIRNNLPAPDASIVANRDAWQVSIEGVRNPRTLTVADLKTIGIETVATVLQCSGNGRGYFPSKPSGTPWTVGAAGCVLWSGVPLRYVVEALGGVAPGMVFLTGTGGEKLPENVDPLSVMVERSVPVKALADALLAWEMNGAPLVARARRAAAPGRPRLQRRQQHQVRQARRLHAGRVASQDHVHRLSHHAARRAVEGERAVGAGAQRQVVRHRRRPAIAASRRVSSTSPASRSAPARRSVASRCRATAAGRGSTRPSSAPISAASPGASSPCRCAWRQATTSSSAAPPIRPATSSPSSGSRTRTATATTAGRIRR